MIAGVAERVQRALEKVEDPEIPGVAIADLGIVRYVREDHGLATIGLSPTYTGCPATEVIAAWVQTAAREAGIEAKIVRVLSPAWSSDDITPRGRESLRRQGIAPPRYGATSVLGRRRPDDGVPCPHCESANTRLRSEFGSTPCKALYHCADCDEPFEYFKCL